MMEPEKLAEISITESVLLHTVENVEKLRAMKQVFYRSSGENMEIIKLETDAKILARSLEKLRKGEHTTEHIPYITSLPIVQKESPFVHP